MTELLSCLQVSDFGLAHVHSASDDGSPDVFGTVRSFPVQLVSALTGMLC